MIAPEGTTKSQRCLLKFARGAFAPGRPVLPVLIDYRFRNHNPGERGSVPTWAKQDAALLGVLLRVTSSWSRCRC